MHGKLPGVGVPLGRTGAEASLHARPRPLAEILDSERKRRRIWEVSSNFHCSIIGTCLTTAELRQILLKMKLTGVDKETDHQLHGRAVLLAGKKDVASKLLQKALDRRHRSALDRFGKARTARELRALWDQAAQQAEIPGAYWAVLTHPHATEDLVRYVFGEVHMLSHLVGAANRADIRRLRHLEAENAALAEKVVRQQGQLRDAVVTREAIIAGLNEMLGNALAAQHQEGTRVEPAEGERETACQVISDLRRQIASQAARLERAEQSLQSVVAERDATRKQIQAQERREEALREEVRSAELAITRLLSGHEEASDRAAADLAGMTLLYVGGRAHQVGQLRTLAERWNTTFLHHDGGIDDRSGLLEAQVARADRTLFPVDCVSHNAVAVIKRVARGTGKPYVPLRSSGLTSFAAALSAIAAEERSARGCTQPAPLP